MSMDCAKASIFVKLNKVVFFGSRNEFLNEEGIRSA